MSNGQGSKAMNLGKENEFTEFKATTAELKEGVKSLSSMLNKRHKGFLYFGVKNNGDVVGQQIGTRTLRGYPRSSPTGSSQSSFLPSRRNLMSGAVLMSRSRRAGLISSIPPMANTGYAHPMRTNRSRERPFGRCPRPQATISSARENCAPKSSPSTGSSRYS